MIKKNNLFRGLITAGICLLVLTGCGNGTVQETEKFSASAADPEFMSFEPVRDIYGNEADLGELIAENDLTMINVWGTFCGPCLSEMPDIEALYEKYEQRGFCVVGLTCDVLDDSDDSVQNSEMNDAKRIAEELNITYPLLAETSEMKEEIKTYAVPTTYFVNSSGEIQGEPLVGSRTGTEWESRISDLLDKVN